MTETQKNQVTKETSVITVDEAIKIAENKAGGKAVEAELDNDDGQLIYEIEVVTDEHEVEFEIDAFSGKIIEIEYDDRWDD